jgi:hypothetical protein
MHVKCFVGTRIKCAELLRQSRVAMKLVHDEFNQVPFEYPDWRDSSQDGSVH